MNHRTAPAPRASVIVRAKNEAEHIGGTLQSLRDQSVPVEIIVVDSGSEDATVAIAARNCDHLLAISQEDFSFGGSLNLGCSASSAPIVFALSAHCRAPGPDWVAESLAHYDAAETGATCGERWTPDRRQVLDAPRVLTPADVAGNPFWGFSNHAASWRRAVWEAEPFDESLTSCEDKEWSWRVMLRWSIVVDPRLVVVASHRRRSGLRSLWARNVREHRDIIGLTGGPTPTPRQMVGLWWSGFPPTTPALDWGRRLYPLRAVELAAGFHGDRRGRARYADAMAASR
jgi:rhamnosyltransferase